MARKDKSGPEELNYGQMCASMTRFQQQEIDKGQSDMTRCGRLCADPSSDLMKEKDESDSLGVETSDGFFHGQFLREKGMHVNKGNMSHGDKISVILTRFVHTVDPATRLDSKTPFQTSF